jgi:hypothetical protein
LLFPCRAHCREDVFPAGGDVGRAEGFDRNGLWCGGQIFSRVSRASGKRPSSEERGQIGQGGDRSIAALCLPAPSTAPISRRKPSRSTGAARLTGEVFGPILHVVRWHADRLDAVLDEIAATGYGLTLGIHSRIDETARHILARLKVGNSYVNRSMIGAVVGVQPFGGEALSGTGPKAGGPRYLHRFATERTVSTDTTAAGGNATLMSLQGETETVAS